jgi:hypothetical protein
LELTRRGLKHDTGLLAAGRNRERLTRIILEQEAAYLGNLAKVNELVEDVKRARRKAKDEKRRQAEAIREKFQHDAEKFIGE